MKHGLSRAAIAMFTSLSVACGGNGFFVRLSAASLNASGAATQRSIEELRRPVLEAQRALGVAAEVTDPAQLTQADIALVIENAYREAESLQESLPRDTFDVEAIATRIGPDPVRIFEWVRDNTSLVPYRGVLRGATGVLMDRLGNSLDRSLLLAALLQNAGINVRLARAELSVDQVAQLGLQPRPAPARPQPAGDTKPSSAALEQYASEHRLDRDKLRQAVSGLRRAADDMERQFKERVASQADDLAKMFEGDRLAGQSEDPVQQLKDHWWVQIEEGPDWLDIDPSHPTARPGRSIRPFDELIPVTDVPSDLYHEVTIRIVIERWQGGKLREAVPFEHTLRPSDVLGKRVVLNYRPLNWPKVVLQRSQSKAILEAALLAQKEWLPVLRVDADTFTQSSFTDSGVINENPGSKSSAQDPRPLADPDGESQVMDSAAGQLSAQWIEYETRIPGRRSDKVRRDNFDLLGQTARSTPKVARPTINTPARLLRAMALTGETDVLPIMCQVSDNFVQHVVNTRFLAQRETLQDLLAKSDDDLSGLIELAGRLDSSSSILYQLALVRGNWSPVRADVYLDRPNILTIHTRLKPSDRREPVGSVSVDIISNEVAVLRSAQTSPFRVRLLQGVVDTSAEALLVANCRGCGPLRNVSELWIVSRRAGTTWLPMRKTDSSVWQRLETTEIVRSRVEKDLGAGYVVILPSRPSQGGLIGWWRIDPLSGTTLGIMASGEGQAMIEYVRSVGITLVSGAAGIIAAGGCGAFAEGVSREKQMICFLCGFFVFWTTFWLLAGGAALVPSNLTQGLFGAYCGLISWFVT